MTVFDAAFHPNPEQRPDGPAWLRIWQAATVAEETRTGSHADHGCKLKSGYDSHIGRMKLLFTQTNQDAIYVAAKGSMGLLVVCDGISTANAGSGDVASGIAAHVIASLWEQALQRLTEGSAEEKQAFLNRALRIANQAVCEAALRFAGGSLDGRVPMGTTAVVALTQGNQVNLAWLGDSRAYLVGPYGAGLLTADQNQAGERLRDWHGGYETSWDPAGYALVGYVGHFNEWGRPEALPASHASLVLLPGERVVLCSDGITDYIGEHHPEVAQGLCSRMADPNPNAAARSLVDMANANGGGDNATVIVFEVAEG